MALTLDTSRPFRSIRELTDLVDAIVAAPLTESEPDWLEWKREVPLGERRWHAQIAKIISSFANCDPGVAQRQVGGCAYLVIGAEPGNVTEISSIDNADLDAGISRFLRSTVRWSPQYIQHLEKGVLVVTIEPPEYGDPIVAMLADYQSLAGNVCRKGDVFIRHHGRTVPATQDDYDMLVRRFAAGEEQVGAMSIRPLCEVTAVPVAHGPSEVRSWLVRKEGELKDSLNRAMPASVFESRSVIDYESEMMSYLSEIVPLLPEKARAEAIAGRVPSMQLMLINDTEHNFKAARVEVSIEGEVWAYESEEHAQPEMPEPPREWGSISSYINALTMAYPVVPTTDFFGPYIDNSGPVVIQFDDIDLRPNAKVKLDPVHLVCDVSLAGMTISARWTVTSESTSGIASGKSPSRSLRRSSHHSINESASLLKGGQQEHPCL